MLHVYPSANDFYPEWNAAWICAVISFYGIRLCLCSQAISFCCFMRVGEKQLIVQKDKTSHTHTHTMFDASSTKWYNRISYSLWRIAIPIHTNTRTCTHLKCYYRINNSHEHHYFSSSACTHTRSLTRSYDVDFRRDLFDMLSGHSYIHFCYVLPKNKHFFSLFIFGCTLIFALSNASDYCYLRRQDFDCV